MREEERVMLQLTGRALFGAKTDFTSADWFSVYRECCNQTLTILIWDTLSDAERAEIPADVAKMWEQDAWMHIMNNEQLSYEQKRILELLDEANVPCVILKGSSAAMFYPDPSLRIMGDIDLLVKPEQQAATAEILLKDGYSRDSDEDRPFHIHISRGAVSVEIHREPNGIYLNENTVCAQELRKFFDDAIERRQYIGDLPVLADDQQAVVLLLHKLGHFLKSGLGLRQLCDWAVFVNARLTSEIWDELEQKLNEFGLLYFTGVITRVCIDYLRLPKEAAPWAMQYDAGLAQEVIEKILKEGNFGHKTDKYGEWLFSNPNASSRISSFFRFLATTGKQRWPVCSQYPILLLVAPFVLLGRYLKLYKKGERPKLNLKKKYEQAEANQKLYRELKPFIIE